MEEFPASRDYVQVNLLTVLVVAVALPLYYYRNRVVEWFRGKQTNTIGWRLIYPACETSTRWHRCLWIVVALASMVPWPLAAQQVPRERLWSIPQEGIGRPDVTGPIGRFEKDASGSYNIYGKNGERVGVGKPRTDGSVDLYDMRGKRGLEIGPQRPGRK